MKDINQSASSSRGNSRGEGSNQSADPTRRSARIHLRNLRRQAAAAASAGNDRALGNGHEPTNPVVLETAPPHGNGAMGPPSSMLDQQPIPVIGSGQGNDQVMVAVPGPSNGHAVRGRKRNRSSGPSVQRRRMYYVDIGESRRESRARAAQLANPELPAGIERPIGVRRVPQGPVVIRAPVQPPHLEVPRFRSYQGSFQWVDPRRQQQQDEEDVREQQYQQQQQEWDGGYGPPPQLDYYGNDPPPVNNAPAAAGAAIDDQVANGHRNELAVAGPSQQPNGGAMQQQQGGGNGLADSHSILVRILNSGMDWEAQRAYHFNAYGNGMGFSNPGQQRHQQM